MSDLTQRIHEAIGSLEFRGADAGAVVISPKNWVSLQYEAYERMRERKPSAVELEPVRHQIEKIFGLPVYIGEIEDEQILVCAKPKAASALLPGHCFLPLPIGLRGKSFRVVVEAVERDLSAGEEVTDESR